MCAQAMKCGPEESPWIPICADVDSWGRVGSLNGRFPVPPKWWNKCEGCDRFIEEHEEIAVDVVFGLPNAVFCKGCDDARR